ncbi:MAG: hypothetical protein HZA59_00020 [Hydrogenophilales bacterium]|nr:hypothetical protein [Hydrogenophilales bacterium]
MGWLSKGKVTRFANELAQELARRYSPAMEKGEDRKISAKGISNILEEIYQRAVDFKHKENLWFFQTATLGNSFRWELKELGYSEKFIEIATEGLVVYLTRKASASSVQSRSAEKK